MVEQEMIENEIQEISKDLAAFKAARNCIQGRIIELEGTPRHEAFVNWAALQIVVNGLIICTARCEGLIEDYQAHLDRRKNVNVVPIKGDHDVCRDRVHGEQG